MNYEEKYKQALERAKVYKNHLIEINDDNGVIGELEYIFPELKENEDELIRKALLDYFQAYKEKEECGITTFNGIPTDNILVWLEKQREQTNPYSGMSFEYNGHIWGMCARDNGVDILLDKQIFKHLEKQGEQKTTNKNKTKFKDGDYIVPYNITPLEIWRVISIDEDGYYNIQSITNHDDEEIYRVPAFTLEKDYHLWTINDAKDGDVLHSTGFHDDCIFIFNGLDKWKFDEPNGDRAVATGYCCLTLSADKMEFDIQGPDCVEVNTVKPATSIQHDLLFQKMEEAGWKWNSVTKELKRITKFKIGDNVHCGDETQPVTIIGITNDSYITDSMIGYILFSEEDNWTLIKYKFNIDDWITIQKGKYYQIKAIYNVDGGYYIATDKDGEDNRICFSIANEYFHLWTIADACDGDVLVASDGSIFIFAGVDDCACKYYVALTTDNYIKINKETDGGYWETSRAVYPATKEQRELLFQKMGGAGWEWDADKKELSKQTLKITPKFCVGQLITDNNGTWYKIKNIKCLDDWYYEVYDVSEDNTHLELCSIIDERFIFKTIFKK